MRRIALEIFKKSRVDSIALSMSHPSMKDALNALPTNPKRPSAAIVLKEKVDAVSEAFNGMNPEVAHLILNTLSGLTDVQLKAVAQKKVLSKVTGSIGNLNPTPEQVGGTKDAEADKPMPEQVYDTEDDDEPEHPQSEPEKVCDTGDDEEPEHPQSEPEKVCDTKGDQNKILKGRKKRVISCASDSENEGNDTDHRPQRTTCGPNADTPGASQQAARKRPKITYLAKYLKGLLKEQKKTNELLVSFVEQSNCPDSRLIEGMQGMQGQIGDLCKILRQHT